MTIERFPIASQLSAEDAEVAARSAGLRHVGDDQPGIRREPAKNGFRYVDPDGKETGDAAMLARIIRKGRDLPGQELFQYIDDDGQQRTIGSADVNDYLREITGEDCTAKDFRAWPGTVLAA